MHVLSMARGTPTRTHGRLCVTRVCRGGARREPRSKACLLLHVERKPLRQLHGMQTVRSSLRTEHLQSPAQMRASKTVTVYLVRLCHLGSHLDVIEGSATGGRPGRCSCTCRRLPRLQGGGPLDGQLRLQSMSARTIARLAAWQTLCHTDTQMRGSNVCAAVCEGTCGALRRRAISAKSFRACGMADNSHE